MATMHLRSTILGALKSVLSKKDLTGSVGVLTLWQLFVPKPCSICFQNNALTLGERAPTYKCKLFGVIECGNSNYPPFQNVANCWCMWASQEALWFLTRSPQSYMVRKVSRFQVLNPAVHKIFLVVQLKNSQFYISKFLNTVGSAQIGLETEGFEIRTSGTRIVVVYYTSPQVQISFPNVLFGSFQSSSF